MLTTSYLRDQNNQSALSGQSTLRPKGAKFMKTIAFSLSLTSLIDAFSILVIYLLMNFGNAGDEIQLAKGIELPTAVQGDVLTQGPVVQISAGKYIIEGKEYPVSQITAALLKARPQDKTKNHLIIQADRRLDFQELSPVIQAGSHAGYEKFKFAVLQEGVAQ
jgi:biopolymer transport protein ExbD